MSLVAWNIAVASLYSVAFLALKALWLICLAAVRRRKDKLRAPFLWLKLTIPLYLLFIILEIVSEGIYIWLWNADFSSQGLITAIDHIGNVAGFLDQIADVFMLLILVEVNLSCLRALGNFNYQKGVRYFNFAIMVVLTALAIAGLALDETWIKKSDSGLYPASWTNVARIDAAYTIIWWVMALPILGLSIAVIVIAYGRQRMRWIARRLLAVSILNLGRCTWELYYAIKFQLNFSFYEVVPEYLSVIEPIFYTWFTVVMVGLLIAIGMKKTNGLWTDQGQVQAPYVPAPYAGQYQQQISAGIPVQYQQQQQTGPVSVYNSSWRPELAATGQGQQQQYYGP